MNHFTIVMVGYNSKPWIRKSIESALNQDYPHFDVIAVDAKTTDGTYEILKEYENFENFKLIRNESRKYQVENILKGVEESKEKSIVCTLDFDDWLIDNSVLSYLDSLYSSDVWMTYGSYVDYFDENHQRQITKKRYSNEVIENNRFRDAPWEASHLRTFRRELFLKINKEDFVDRETGNMYDMAGDLVFMFPMLEMSGSRFRVSSKPLYVYNKTNPLSEDKVSLVRQRNIDHRIRNQNKRYSKIESLYD